MVAQFRLNETYVESLDIWDQTLMVIKIERRQYGTLAYLVASRLMKLVINSTSMLNPQIKLPSIDTNPTKSFVNIQSASVSVQIESVVT